MKIEQLQKLQNKRCIGALLMSVFLILWVVFYIINIFVKNNIITGLWISFIILDLIILTMTIIIHLKIQCRN